MLDSQLLDAYIEGSWGYGNPAGDLWFVGMEQGGGTSFEEIQRRLAAWDKAGRAPFDDIHEYCLAIGELRWTGPNPRIQPTWKHLIRIVLAARGAEVSPDTIRRYQVESFARRAGTTCLLELLPLPSRNMATWRFHEWTQMPKLQDRATYLAKVGDRREAGLRHLIDRHAPRAVVFYGLGYLERWQRIVEAPLTSTGIEGVTAARRGSVLCLVVPHPVAHGLNGAFFQSVGRHIAAG